MFKINSLITFISIFLVSYFFSESLFAQASIQFDENGKVIKPFKSDSKSFLISYAIVIKTGKANSIAETYNGGIKTTFVKNDMARIRLVSLMRTQSVFLHAKNGLEKKNICIIKESGKQKTKLFLSPKQWNFYNKKVYGNRCEIFRDDTSRILNLLCTKAILTMKDSSKVMVYFYPSKVNKTLVLVEPMFAKIPGLVMQYSFTKNKRTIECTATSLKITAIPSTQFLIPTIGYKKIRFLRKGSPVELNEEDEEDDMTDEEENIKSNIETLGKDSLQKNMSMPTLQK